MTKTILKLSFIILIFLSLTGCGNSKKEESKTSPKISIPEWDKNAENKIWFAYKEWHHAKKDPMAATNIGYAYSEKLNDYEKAIEWYKYSDSIKPLPETSNYACYAYQQLKQYKEAIKWCEDAINLGNKKALFQLATTYFKLENFEDSLNYFLKSADSGNTNAFNNIGLVYSKLNKFEKAKEWLKKAISNGNLDAYGNISNLYLDHLNNKIKGAAYAIALINTKYTKDSVINVLKNDAMLDSETIKKGYELQLTSDDFPIKYKGDLGL